MVKRNEFFCEAKDLRLVIIRESEIYTRRIMDYKGRKRRITVTYVFRSKQLKKVMRRSFLMVNMINPLIVVSNNFSN